MRSLRAFRIRIGRAFILYIKSQEIVFFFIQKHEENVLVNKATPSIPTAVSLTVRDRRHRDESNAERIFENILKYCKKVTL